MRETIVRTVNNRELVLGIDYLYREAMKIFEVETLLPLSTKLLEILEAKTLKVPIEGYYGESEELKEYFIAMRSLQSLSREDNFKVKDSIEFQTLYEVSTSPIFGQKVEDLKFFPEMQDPLYFALKDTPLSDWSEKTLTEKAYEVAKDLDDYSLVGLAALCKDSIVMTALRESVVLYAGICVLGLPPKYKYQWNVDVELEVQANRFISTFNELTSSDLLPANTENAQYFYDAFENNDIKGRCVRIAYDDSKMPINNYHWAINIDKGELVFDEFWNTELWTTEMYKDKRLFLKRFKDLNK